THGYKPDVLGWLLSSLFQRPWVAYSHGWTEEGAAMRAYRWLDERVIHHADRVVAVSEARRRDLLAAGVAPRAVVTLHNAVRLPGERYENPSTLRAELGVETQNRLVGVIGRLSPEKGQRYFIEAMATVSTAFPNTCGILFGDGPDEPELQRVVGHLGLQKHSVFAGHRPDVDRGYQALDMVVVPSLSEGLPNVVLEAMAHARPVVAAAVGGVPEIIDDGSSGILVKPADPHALAQAILTVLRDSTLGVRMGVAGRIRVATAFSVESRTQRVLAVYDEVMRHRAARRDHERRRPTSLTH